MLGVCTMSSGTPRAGRQRASWRGTPLLLFLGGCGEGISPVGLDASQHDRCTGAPPLAVDASASEIQCRVDDYVFSTNADEATPIAEQGTNVPGSPICCEVCAVEGTADDVCESTCKHELCSRARDIHVMVGQRLSGFDVCGLVDCGFSFEACIDTNLLHIQAIVTNQNPTQFYGLQASCHAGADEPARADGLFTYLEELDGVPGASGSLGNVQDVVAYCLDAQAGGATDMPPESTTLVGTSTPPLDDGADSTGGTGVATDTGEAPDPGRVPTPVPCGPYAEERFWVRPTNNFGTWNEVSGGVLGNGAAMYDAVVTGGGISYTMFPCEGVPGATCIRLDRLSVQLAETASGLVMRLSMQEDPLPMPITDQGHFDVPPGAVRLAVRYGREGEPWLVAATNAERARGHIDAIARTIRIEGLGASSEQGDTLATLALEGTLTNTQPRTEIVESHSPRDGSLLLTAETVDAELDPIEHQWTIPGVGSWRGDAITPSLPPGRHAVILYADDVHRARGVAARWLDVAPTTGP
jgi:hypothetical protein